MAYGHDGYLSPKLEGRLNPLKGGFGVFVRERVARGELLVIWCGRVLTLEELSAVSESQRSRSVQVEEDLFMVPVEAGDPADHFNHCCDPNAGLVGQITLVALRDIAPGEEVCFDYAMTDASPYDEFECQCGSPQCRKRVTGNDWQKPALQARYAGHFSPYIQRRIDQRPGR